MIKKIFLDIVPVIIMVAMFGFVFSTVIGLFDIPFLYKYTTNSPTATQQITMWRYDIIGYIKNIDGSFNSLNEMKISENPLTWHEITSNILQEEFWQDLGNNLAFILNSFLFFINVLIFPIRFLAYIVINLLSLLGMVRTQYIWQNPITYQTTTYDPNWLMNIFLWIANNFQIPFVN